jgi:uncharacterized protein YyaL (SSP411 family)
MANRLAQESSPYLLQHADNPVDWYPWGEEALERARSEDKPILLSIGYSACHWCHVMERESFENEQTARLMNENFINIKVDREERPDLDHIYMEAVQTMTGSGGWPLTVFLTPDGIPFFGGTYFPPEDRYNMPGFPKVLKAAANTYRQRRREIERSASQVRATLSGALRAAADTGPLTEGILRQAFNSLEQSFDRRNGGFDGAPKFPHPLSLEFLLRYYAFSKDPSALEIVTVTLDKMAAGGIYDQIGGGFHRYSTDDVWLVPHFEKMLYDNALLSRVYLAAYQVTGWETTARIAEETLDYVLREMRSPEGGFYSTQDADSEGEEGKFYLWTPGEVREVLGEDTGREIEAYYGVSERGYTGNRNILHRTGYEMEASLLQDLKRKLLEKRETRVKPGRDEKVLASWNGMMLTALAGAADVLRREDYRSAAEANGRFLLESMMSEGGLRHVYKDGQARIKGFLEDYAAVIEGLLCLHQATLDRQWLQAGIELCEKMAELFYDPQTERMYDTEAGQSDLIVRPRNDYDSAVPAGTSTAVLVLLKMALITGNEQYRRIAEQELKQMKDKMGLVPLGFSQWLCALDFYLSAPKEIVLVGDRDNPQSRSLMRAINSKWIPNKVAAALDPGPADPLRNLPLFRGKQPVGGQPAVYICRNYTCQAPVTSPEELERQLEGGSQAA